MIPTHKDGTASSVLEEPEVFRKRNSGRIITLKYLLIKRSIF